MRVDGRRLCGLMGVGGGVSGYRKDTSNETKRENCGRRRRRRVIKTKKL